MTLASAGADRIKAQDPPRLGFENPGEIKLWDVRSGQQRACLKGHTSFVWSVAYSPDGKTIASSGGYTRWWHRDLLGAGFDGPGPGPPRGEIKLWDAQTGQERASFRDHASGVWCVAFSPDGKTLVSGGREIKVWDVPSGRERASLKGHTRGVHAVAVSPDGVTIASAGGVSGEPGELTLWDVRSGQARASLQGHGGPVRSVCFSPDGNTLVSGSWDQTIKLWAVRDGQLRTSLQGHTGMVQAVCISPDGRTLASAASNYRVCELKLWDATDGQQPVLPKAAAPLGQSGCFSPDGKTFAACYWSGTITLWDTRTGLPRLSFAGHKGYSQPAVFSPDGKTLTTAGNSRRWWENPHQFVVEGPGEIRHEIRQWDVRSGQLIASRTFRTSFQSPLAFSPDGKTLAVGDNGVVRLWDVQSGRQRDSFKGRTSSEGLPLGITCLAFSPDGGTLAAGNGDGTITLLEAHSGRGHAVLQRHRGTIYDVVFSPDGKTLASVSEAGTVKIVVRAERTVIARPGGNTPRREL
jgi:WD40 repeat protein